MITDGVDELAGLSGGSFDWEAWDAACEKKSIALSVVDSVVTDAIVRSRAPDLLQRVIRHSVGENLTACLDAVELNFVARVDNESQRRSLLSEPERVHGPASIDTWARGVLSVKYQPKQKTQGRSSMARLSMTPMKKLSLKEQSVSGDTPNSAKLRTGRDSLKFSRLCPIVDRSNRKKLTQKQVDLEQRLRDELEARKNAQEVLRQAEANDVEEKKRLQALQQELRGKEYGYDQSGQVVVLNRLDPDRLPPSSVSLKFRFSDRVKPDEAAGGAAMGLANSKRQGAGEVSPTKKQTDLVKEAKPVPEFLKKTKSGLPSMMESMKIVPGVTIREGDLVKAGPKTDTTAGMTRQSYLMKKQLELESTMDEESGNGMVSNNTWGENTFNGQEFGILQMIQSAEDPAVAAASGRKVSVTNAGDVVGASTSEEKGPVVESMYEETDINLVLTRAADWGENNVSPTKVSLPKPPKQLKQFKQQTPRGRLSKEN